LNRQADGSAPAPASRKELFTAFQSLALQGFGGVLPVSQRILVEQRQWLNRSDFLALMSLAQMLPGPNIINMALIFGDRHFGWRGALAACAGLLVAPLVIVLALAVLVQQASHLPWMNDALRGMGVVAAGLILSTALKLVSALRDNPMGRWICFGYLGVSACAIALFRWPLIAVLGIAAPLAWLTAWWCLRPRHPGAANPGGQP
jgi:chromate transporter